MGFGFFAEPMVVVVERSGGEKQQQCPPKIYIL
jgi:hypothetical protein